MTTCAMPIDDARFEAWLSRETGMDAASLGANTLRRAVLERARVTQGGTHAAPAAPFLHADAFAPPPEPDDAAIDAYWHMLNASPDERQTLIEALVVPETWFFREREAFAALAQLAVERLMRAPARVLRLLSVPCSSGEEPYSIAMALLDAGVDPARFVIDAADISARAIERARQGLYGRNSFRGHSLEFRDRHFSETADGWRLDERVRQAVRFTQANLFESPPTCETGYDFIFCRNVLIYFHRDAQDAAIRLLDARLAEGGTIFVGPAETGLMMRHALTSARIPLAFAFQRTPAGAPAAAIAPAAVPPWPMPPAAVPAAAPSGAAPRSAAKPAWLTARLLSRPAAPAPFDTPFDTPQRSQAAAPDAAQPQARVALDEAQRLADSGRLDDAEHIAREFMKMHGPDANAFYLLGLIADARGRDSDAKDAYRKALYLDAAHYEALTHLAALLDMAGDEAGAERLMLRARRAMAQQEMTGTGRADVQGESRGSHRS
ncbi:putative biofilm formation methyltransferase WspC [Burkholderia multivorans]